MCQQVRVELGQGLSKRLTTLLRVSAFISRVRAELVKKSLILSEAFLTAARCCRTGGATGRAWWEVSVIVSVAVAIAVVKQGCVFTSNLAGSSCKIAAMRVSCARSHGHTVMHSNTSHYLLDVDS
jgi:hypothetical protein